MRNRPFVPLLVLILSVFTLFISCSKKDRIAGQQKQAFTNEELVQRFFHESLSDDPAVQKVTSKIKAEFEKSIKLPPFIRREGLPVWNKSLIIPQQVSGSGFGSGTTGTRVITPLYPLDSSQVRSALLSTIIGDSVRIELLDGKQYQRYAKEHKRFSAQDVTLTLMLLDNSVQGHDRFEITDSIALTGGEQKAKFIKVQPFTTTISAASREYVTISICWSEERPTNQGQVVGCPPGSNCPQYETVIVCKTLATFIIENSTDDPGGGGTWIDPTPPLSGGGTGWQPAVEPPEPPSLYKKPAKYREVSNYVTPAGTVVTLAEGAEVIVYENIDVLRDYPNGALYALKYNNKIYVSVQGEYIKAGAQNLPPPAFTGYREYKDGKVTDTPMPEGVMTQTQPNRFGKMNAVRMKVVPKTDADGCKVVRDLVELGAGTAPPNSYNTPGDANFGIEDLPSTDAEREETGLQNCPGSATIGDFNATTDNYVTQNGAALSSFLNSKIKSSVKILFFDKTNNKVRNYVTKSDVGIIPRNDQTSIVDKFNNNSFTAADEEILIMAYIENGQWKYDAKYNAARFPNNAIHPQAAAPGMLQNLQSEIKYQTDQAVSNIRGANRTTAEEAITTPDGEKFYKAQMGMLETVSVFFDIGKSIIKDGALPKSVWDDGRRANTTLTDEATAYANSALKMGSGISGGIDQFIDETTGILQLARTGLEVLRNPRATFNTIYSTIKDLNVEKVKQLILDMTGAANYMAGGTLAKYQAGRHTVQVAMSVFSAVNTLQKGKEILKAGGTNVTNLQKFVPDGSVNHPAANSIRNATEHKYPVDNYKDQAIVMQNKVNNEDIFVSVERNGTGSTVFEAKQSDFVDPNGYPLSNTQIQADLADGIKVHELPGDNLTTYEFQKGKKGAWSKELNKHPLDANKVYKLPDSQYFTDEIGRVKTVEVPNLVKVSPTAPRNSHQQTVKSKAVKDGIPGDEGGHIIGSQFDGCGDQINIVPMKSTLNGSTGTWYQMEKKWSNILTNNGTITGIEITLDYGVGTSRRPNSFLVRVLENGVETFYTHTN